MNFLKLIKLVVALGVFLSVAGLAFGQDPAPPDHQRLFEEARQFMKLGENTVVMQANYHCHPAEVIAFADRKPAVLVSHVTVENRSDKSISAIQLGWKVYESNGGELKCGIPAKEQVLLSGTTPLINLVTLNPTETIEIQSYETLHRLRPPNVTHTMVNKHVFLSAMHLGALLSSRREGQKYAVALYVHEIKFTDGTAWTFEAQ